jgi:TonB family protein
MYFDFEDYRPDTPRVETAITRREAVLLSIIAHLAAILLILFGPSLPTGGTPTRAAQFALRDQALRDSQRFVFVQPRVDTEALRPPPRAEDSDKNREARSRERPPDPKNALPFSRGNSTERIEENPGSQMARAEPPPEAGTNEAGQSADAGRETSPPGGSILTMPNARTGPAPGQGRGVASGALGDALRNLQRYVDGQSFENPQGGGPFGPEIQFDTRGVEFGPWIRRFVAQVKRNWFIPYAAMAMKGHVVITFNVHGDGTISDLDVIGPSSVDSFNNAAYNALASSNPTQPLPPEYPSDHAFFTVTFYYNETPASY